MPKWLPAIWNENLLMSGQSLGICAMSVGGSKVCQHCNALVFFAGQERWKICFEGVGIALLCNQWMLMCTSANHYNILQIQDCLGYPADSPRNCNGLLLLELRYFGQHKNLMIYFIGSYEESW